MKAALKLYFLLLVALSVSCMPARYAINKSTRHEYKITSELPEDSSANRLIAPYRDKLKATMNEVLAHSDIAMPKTLATETLIGNFFADAVLSEARKISPDIDFAMPSTNGGIRNGLPKGNITRADIFELMPFENECVVLTMSGADVQKLAEYIAATGGQPVADIRMTIANKKPHNIIIGDKPLSLARKYYVLTSDYVASGGDKADFGKPEKIQVLGLKIRDALLNYVINVNRAGKLIHSNLDKRISYAK